MFVFAYCDAKGNGVTTPETLAQHIISGVEQVPLTIIAVFEGPDWEDCMRQYHEFMGWEPYRPMD
jgi:ADP-ribosylglycohydrolase